MKTADLPPTPFWDSPAPMSRRAALLGGLTTAAGLMSGCATNGPASSVRPVRYRLPPAIVSPERVIRTTVGLRPYRAAGFVVRTDRYDETTVIHNYGHGGGGISLSWGSSKLAVDLAMEVDEPEVAVLGSGVMGLTTARLLQDMGRKVTIYTRQLPPYTTSNMSGGQWNPTSVANFADADPAFISQFQAASRFAWRHYQNLVGPRYGVRWVENFVLLNQRPEPSSDGLRELVPDVLAEWSLLGPGEHPFHTPFARRYLTMLVDPAVMLDTLTRDVAIRGGEIVIQDFRTIADVTALEQKLVINCTGLGAGALFNDPDIMPIKGQLAVLVPQPEMDYIAQYGSYYTFPRSDGVILGGSYQRGDWSLENDPETIARIVAGNAEIFQRMRG